VIAEDRMRVLFAEANPIPDEAALVLDEREVIAYLAILEQRISEAPQQSSRTNQPSRYRGPAWAVAVFVVLAVPLLYLAFSGDSDQVADTQPTPTTVAADPSPEPTTPPSEAEVTELLNGFLEARIAGEGAQQYLNDPEGDIPLLYTTTSGAHYERAEFEPVRGIDWPYGFKAFKVRLYAGDTVVEQLFFTPHDLALYPDPARAADARLGLEYQPDGFGTDIAPTTEDGQPPAMTYNFFDGEVTLHAAHPWVSFGPGGPIKLIPKGSGPTTDGAQRNDWDRLLLVADPSPPGTHCLTGPAPADAEALAENIRSDPELDATAPVTVSGGGTGALMMDLVGTGAIVHACNGDPGSDPVLSSGKHIGLIPGYRVRLYLFDAPEGASMRILAIAIDVPESRFERAVEGPVPVVEFHAP